MQLFRILSLMLVGHVAWAADSQWPLKLDFIDKTEITPWKAENLSDPALHSENKYSYIVHGFEFPETALDSEQLRAFLSDYFNPMFFQTQEIVSGSFVTEKHNLTWGAYGFILEVPAESIITAAPYDLGSTRLAPLGSLEEKRGYLKELHQKGFASPQELIAAAIKKPGPGEYNEVDFLNVNERGERFQIKGLFVRTDSFGNSFLSSRVLNIVHELGRLKRLPIVKFNATNDRPIVRVDKRILPGTEKSSKFVYVIHAPQAQFLSLISAASKHNRTVIGLIWNQDEDRYETNTLSLDAKFLERLSIDGWQIENNPIEFETK